MITLYGVTEDGTSVPVQVTEDGKIVAVGQKGDKGDPGTPGADGESIVGPPGPEGPPGEVQNGDDVNFNSVDTTGSIHAGGPISNGNWFKDGSGTYMYANGGLYIRGDHYSTTAVIKYYNGGKTDLDVRFAFLSDGSMTAAGNKCGFTGAGDLIFTSRGDRFKMVVQNGLCHADPYPLSKELQEKLDKREPNTPDIVLPDE